MPSLHPSLVISLLALPFVTGHEQKPLVHSDAAYPSGKDAPRIAIVGAGIAGASAAYHLHELGGSSSPSITIYEREQRVGGRIKSIRPLENQAEAFEGGASRFSGDDWCVMEAMEALDLQTNSLRPSDRPWTSGVWDGQNLTTPVLECTNEQILPWKAVQAIWEYGLSPVKMYRAVMSNLGQWWSFGQSKKPFDSIRKELEDAGLGNLVTGSAEAFFRNQSISSKFLSAFVQPCTRNYFSRNLADTSGLASLKAGGPSYWRSIAGGNDQLVKGMIGLSQADVHLGSDVVMISYGQERRYRVSVQATDSEGASKREHTEFDSVILAAPLQTSKLYLDDLDLSAPSPLAPYVERHVTLFKSSMNLSPEFFNLPADTIVPYDILTTASSEHNPNILSITHTFVDKDEDCGGPSCDIEDEFVYRIASQRRVDDRELVGMVGGQIQKGSSLADHGISWVNRQAWPHTFPQPLKDGSFVDKVELAPDFFYLNGAEEVLSSMEMSCRMGKNAAKKLS
ncbi:hypothetical protein N7492_000270 [Penicillium capsulatum]|uniref:Prenylcysteine lyase domain-containing protein n=1 Tax=Penicillium capsulatum TaxID=69766 RepID=A0A9W9IPA2_9EURO|nr:hypothetical protein N7492_000270 [Penicillium capsulatum]KAJ6130664.1 hypothetical protein N7512_003444 [Penicillium capsulatum]